MQRFTPQGPTVVLHINLALQGRKCVSNRLGFCLSMLVLQRVYRGPMRGRGGERKVFWEMSGASRCKYRQWERGVVVCGSTLVLFIRFNTSQRFMVGISCTICIIGFICPRSGGGGGLLMEPVSKF